MNKLNKVYSDSFYCNEKIGWIIYSDAGLYGLILPQNNNPQPLNTLLKNNSYTEKLNNYFLGKNVDLSVKIDLSGYSVFEKSVFEACINVKYANVASYKNLAVSVGKHSAYRAAANALKKNRLPIIIPCHRIIRENGDLGGYNFGTKYKSKLLKLEKRET